MTPPVLRPEQPPRDPGMSQAGLRLPAFSPLTSRSSARVQGAAVTSSATAPATGNDSPPGTTRHRAGTAPAPQQRPPAVRPAARPAHGAGAPGEPAPPYLDRAAARSAVQAMARRGHRLRPQRGGGGTLPLGQRGGDGPWRIALRRAGAAARGFATASPGRAPVTRRPYPGPVAVPRPRSAPASLAASPPGPAHRALPAAL